jgi:Cu2+-exporting ATPase
MSPGSRARGEAPGRRGHGGAINGEGSIVVEVEKRGRVTYLAQVIDLVQKAQEEPVPDPGPRRRAAIPLVVIALSVGAVTFAAWFASE